MGKTEEDMIGSVEEDLREMRFRVWRRDAPDRNELAIIVRQA